MLYREIIAVCSQIHTKHIHTLCGQNVELLNFKLVVYIVTTGLKLQSSTWQEANFFSPLSVPHKFQCLLLKDIPLGTEGCSLTADRYTWPNFAARIEVV